MLLIRLILAIILHQSQREEEYQNPKARKARRIPQLNLIIKGYEEHRDLLVDMLKRAQEEILISSKSISYQTYEIYTAFKEAINRGVKIWVYADNSETSLSDDDFCDFLENNGSFLEFLNIHAKFLIIDGKSLNGQAVIGSHNWLSEMDDSQGVNGDSSILISDPDAVKRLRGKTFQTAIKYNDRASALLTPNIPNVTSIQDEINRIQLAEFSIGDMTFKYLTTLVHHEEFLRNFASIAEERLVIYSPFITLASARKRLNTVFSVLKPTTTLVLHIKKEDKNTLKKLLKSGKWSQRVKLKIKDDFIHRKTLKVDRHIRVEGSFNWLSAATDEDSGHHNMETSLVLISPQDKQ